METDVVDFEAMTPPGSPILGYCRSRDVMANNNSTPQFGDDARMFQCKGAVVSNDFTLSSDGLFRRNEVVWSTDSMQASEAEGFPRNGDLASRCSFFGFKFDLALEEDLVALISVCRKRLAVMELMVGGQNANQNLSPPIYFALRSDAARMAKFLVQNRSMFSGMDTRRIFHGLTQTLGYAKHWPSSLRQYEVSGDENNCLFHLFHTHLELRWTLLVFFKLNSHILHWVMDDLLRLSFFKFKNTLTSRTKTAFNCYCVMEFWAMLRLLVDEKLPNGVCFSDLVKSRLSDMQLDSSDLFPVWLTYHLSPLSGFDNNGIWNSALKPENEGTELNQILKRWLTNNANGPASKIIEVHSLIRDFLPNIGFDLTFVITLWAYWLQKLDKGYEVRNMDNYTSATKWLRLVVRICDLGTNASIQDSPQDTTLLEPFHSFLTLLVEVINQSSVKNWRTLVSSLCGHLTLTSRIVEAFGENGLTRMVTLILCMAYVGKSNVPELCQRLNELLNFAKKTLRSIKFRARSTVVLLLLRKSQPVGNACAPLVKTVDEIMGTIHRSPAERDIIMSYWDLIQNLPQVSPYSELDQSKLINVNLNPWLASCGPNYLVRTLRILHSLFDSWILNTNSVPTTQKSMSAKIIVERADTFIQQSVVGNLGAIDVEPLADLAVDFTVFHKLNRNNAGAFKIFERCALSPQAYLKVSELYLDRLIGHRELDEWDNSFLSEIHLVQSWVRLVISGAVVPLKLTAKVLSSHYSTGISVTSGNDILLREFLDFINSDECFWTNAQLTEILSPISHAVKITLENGIDTETMESVVSSAVSVLERAPWKKIYSKNLQSCLAVKILEAYVPPFLGKPPWEKLSIGVVQTLKSYLHKIFIVISSKDWTNDPFLKRKLGDTFRFGFLGFITTVDLDDSNPGLLIMRYIETLQSTEPLLKELLFSLQQLTKEESLMKRFLLATMGFLKRKMILTSVWLYGLVLDIMVETSNEVGSKCGKLLTSCVMLALNNRDTPAEVTHRLRSSLELTMNKHFSLKSKRFFEFLNTLVEQGSRRANVARFLQQEIIPVLKIQIRNSEMKQGGVPNGLMREHLLSLTTNLARAIQQVRAESLF